MGDLESDFLSKIIYSNKKVSTTSKNYVVNSLSKDYWTGWITAYLQWDTGRTFKDIVKQFAVSSIRESYFPYHEMEDSRFVEDVRELEDFNEGEYHLVTVGWIYNSKGELLLQKRAANKVYPLIYANHGGSALKGETSVQSMIREIYEE